jgi:hypothetical protein
MSERNLIAEAEKPERIRAWNFYIWNGVDAVPLIVAVHDGRKYLTTPGAVARQSSQPCRPCRQPGRNAASDPALKVRTARCPA